MRIYLDHNATTPLRPEALAAMREALEATYGNPSSAHFAGAAARAAVDRARAQVAGLLGADPERVIFTASATEANNTVVRSAARSACAGRGARDRIVTCGTEHPSVLETCESLEQEGIRVVRVELGSDGRLDPDAFSAALDDRTLLASVMWANNETGVIQPVPELARRARERGVPFHTDAVQALGKLPLALAALPLEFASFAAHKLGGPKGIGALYLAPGAELTPLLRGGPQERRRRAGTENVPGIVGFGAACAAAGRDLDARAERLGSLRDRLWLGIEKSIPDAWRNGSAVQVLPHTLNVSFPGAAGDVLVAALDLEGIAVASGAACHSGSTEPSHVLLAMGLSRARAACTIRLSLGFDTDAGEVERVLERLPGIVERVRAQERA